MIVLSSLSFCGEGIERWEGEMIKKRRLPQRAAMLLAVMLITPIYVGCAHQASARTTAVKSAAQPKLMTFDEYRKAQIAKTKPGMIGGFAGISPESQQAMYSDYKANFLKQHSQSVKPVLSKGIIK